MQTKGGQDMQKLYTATMIAEDVGVSPSCLVRHARFGTIPRPLEEVGGRRYYSADQRDLILVYFQGRERFSRLNKQGVK